MIRTPDPDGGDYYEYGETAVRLRSRLGLIRSLTPVLEAQIKGTVVLTDADGNFVFEGTSEQLKKMLRLADRVLQAVESLKVAS